MEHVEGDTLTDVMHRTKLSIEDVIRYGTQIADALAAAPARGVVHRDLKAGNIMVTPSASRCSTSNWRHIAVF